MASAGLDLFGVPALPAPIQFFMVAHFRFHESEAGQEVAVRLEVRDAHLNTVGAPATFPMTPTLSPSHIPGWEGGINVIVPSAVEVSSAGAHSLQISIDGEPRGWDLPFMVFVGEPAPL